MAKKVNQTWVSPNKSTGDWKVSHPGAKRASGIYPTKAEAISAGRRISRNQKTEFIVQRRDGQIDQKDSHGNDPRNIPG